MNTLKTLIYLLILSIHNLPCKAQEKFILEVEIPENERRDSFLLRKTNIPVLTGFGDPQILANTIKEKVVNGKIKFTVPLTKMIVVVTDLPIPDLFLAEPGDSIFVTFKNGKPVFSGNGYEKLKMALEASQIGQYYTQRIVDIRKSSDPAKDYLYYCLKNRELMKKQLALLDTFKGRISEAAYIFLLARFISRAEICIQGYFNDLTKVIKKAGITPSRLASLYDSTLSNSLFLQLGLHNSDTASLVDDLPNYLQLLKHTDYLRSYGFTWLYDSNRSMDSTFSFLLHMYELDKKTFRGLAWEKIAVKRIRFFVKHFGFKPEINKIIEEYLNSSGFPEYKDGLKIYVKNKKALFPSAKAPEFSLTDNQGHQFNLSDLKGKYVILDTWFTGCSGCIGMATTLRNIKGSLPENGNIVFLNVSVDNNKQTWLQSIKKKKYTSGEGLNAYTDGLGTNHPMIQSYGITSYPAIFVIDPDGFIIPAADPRGDNGKEMIALLKSKLAKQFDGPYILYKNNQPYAYSISPGKKAKSVPLSLDSLTAVTNIFDRKISIRLKEEINPEPCEYPMPSKLLALSDIEGNFEALKKILVNNGVMDSSYNWTYGNGHLVCNGDFFDRGEQVTECLWLIYMLEEKAKKNGGYVHFILGNHEIMNMNGENRYTHPKYMMASTILNEKYNTLWGQESELGRWLRSKNIIEKIGDMLFVHGGIHPVINESTATLKQINELARPFYDEAEKVLAKGNLKQFYYFNGKTSPFWYRRYYKEERLDDSIGTEKTIASASSVDSTLKKFDVSVIITGHTIVADTISVHYEGKIINIDTPHAHGKSEALLCEDNRFFRVDMEGKKEKMLFENKIATTLNLPKYLQR